MAGRKRESVVAVKMLLLIGLISTLAWNIHGKTCATKSDCLPDVECFTIAWMCNGTTDTNAPTPDPVTGRCCEQLDTCGGEMDVAGWLNIRVTNITLDSVDFSAEWLDTFVTEGNATMPATVKSAYVGSWNTLTQAGINFPSQMFVAEPTNSCTIDGQSKWPEWYQVVTNVVADDSLDSTLEVEERQHKDCLCDIEWYCQAQECLVETANVSNQGADLTKTSPEHNFTVMQHCSTSLAVINYTASSYFSLGFKPDQAELDSWNFNTSVEGGWAPQLEDSDMWIMLHLPEDMTVSGIITQGVSVNPERRVDEFLIEYTDAAGDTTTIDTVFKAGARLDSKMLNSFSTPWKAKEVKITVQEPCDPYYVGLRVQLVGCPYCTIDGDCIGIDVPNPACDTSLGICYEKDLTTTVTETTTVSETITEPLTTIADTTTASDMTISTQDSTVAGATTPPDITLPPTPPTTTPQDQSTQQLTTVHVTTTDVAKDVVRNVIGDQSVPPEVKETITDLLLPTNLNNSQDALVENITLNIIETGLSVIRNITVAANATQDDQLQGTILEGSWYFMIAVADSKLFADPSQSSAEKEELLKEFVGVASLVLDEDRSEAWSQVQEDSVAGPLGIVTSVESIAIQVAASSEGSVSVNFTDKNIEGFIIGKPKEEFDMGYMLTISGSDSEQSDVSISIPKESFSDLENVPDDGTVVIVVLKFSSIGQVLSKNDVQDQTDTRGGSKRLGSDILSISVVDTAGGTHSLPLSFTLGHDVPIEKENPRCNYWQPKNGDKSAGSWDSHGCTTILVGHEATKCSCEHMTNFAILMWLGEEPPPVDPISEVITKIGCYVSIVSLAVSLALLLYLKSSLTSERIIIHMHLMSVTLIAMVLFVAGSDKTDSGTLCKFITISLHFFFMSMFSWMLVEGIHLYRQIISVFESERSQMWIYFAVGWGIPLIVVGVTSPIFYAEYGTHGACWLSKEDNSIWAFMAPMIPTILVNLVVLFMVSRIVMSAAKLQQEKPAFNSAKAGLRSSLLLLPILGVTWVFGYFITAGKIFQYAFVTLNAFQGFFMALFHCFMSSEVNGALKQKIKKVKDSSMGGVSTMDTSQKPAMFTSGIRKVKVAPSTDDTDGY